MKPRRFDPDKLARLVEEAGGPKKVSLAHEAIHGEPLARTTLMCWMDGSREPGTNRLLALVEDVFDKSIDEVLTPAEELITDDEWYTLISKPKAKGPKLPRGPYKGLRATYQAIARFKEEYPDGWERHFEHATPVCYGPFENEGKARRARYRGTGHPKRVYMGRSVGL